MRIESEVDVAVCESCDDRSSAVARKQLQKKLLNFERGRFTRETTTLPSGKKKPRLSPFLLRSSSCSSSPWLFSLPSFTGNCAGFWGFFFMINYTKRISFLDI